ncbi:MAG: hypothetical protein KAT17_09570, partial [Candidatus Aminicenantes bacterium]|nr:hypothetical protein [Candidatus Aminicenantes bacterium]
KLNATRLLPAVIMKENVAVFLMNKKIKFFNPFKKKVHNFNLKTIIDSNPVYLKNYLYFLAHKKNKKKQAISKLGNHYFVKIKTDPEFLKPLGQSIQFNLTPINLIKPEFNINIYHQSKGNIFKTKIKHDQVRSFVWIPDEPGKYKIELNINAINKKNMTIKKNIKIIDVEKIIRAFNYKIMQECQIDVWIQKKQPE